MITAAQQPLSFKVRFSNVLGSLGFSQQFTKFTHVILAVMGGAVRLSEAVVWHRHLFYIRCFRHYQWFELWKMEANDVRQENKSISFIC